MRPLIRFLRLLFTKDLICVQPSGPTRKMIEGLKESLRVDSDARVLGIAIAYLVKMTEASEEGYTIFLERGKDREELPLKVTWSAT